MKLTECTASCRSPQQVVAAAESSVCNDHGLGAFAFSLNDAPASSNARGGRIVTRHGTVETPAFMPVGTQATVKTLTPRDVRATGAEMILANTYHLMLRPGPLTLQDAGGLHRFMAWDGPILTDSGGFQIFSLAGNVRVDEQGVTFRSHIDGSAHRLDPERAVELQLGWGSDIVMALDHLVGLPSTPEVVLDATERTHRWLERGVRAFDTLGGRKRGAFFGICQGGMDPRLRQESAEFLGTLAVSGCAIGGLSVGEPKPVMAEMLQIACAALPTDKPRYLMGVGSPEDLWMGVAHGVDLFDCVLPTRIARNGALFTPDGRVNIKNRQFAACHAPLDESCDCELCQTFTAAYLHHLFRAREILGLRLASIHNLRFLARQIEEMRRAIAAGSFDSALAAFQDRYRPVIKNDAEHA